MFAARQRFVLLLIADLCLGAYGAPAKKKQEKTDPELTAGYFHGNMDVGLQRNGLISWKRHWPNATVHYKIDQAFSTVQTDYIKLAMRRIGYVSCIRFVPATPETLDYVLITIAKKGCYSKVGYLGGKQAIHLEPNGIEFGCFKIGNIEHELLHTLGFYHQQSSSNRDKYIKVMYQNIKDNRRWSYTKYGENVVDNFGAKYDYGSLMHDGNKYYTKNGKATMVALNPIGYSRMGQRYAMTSADIKRLNIMYKCPWQ